MNIPIYILCILTVLLFSIVYIGIYISLIRKIKKSEQRVVDIFLQKISKIPAVIEVMRPYVVDSNLAFGLMTRLHSEGMIHEYDTIHALLEHNARINDQY